MAENMFERYRPAASPEVSDDNQFKQFAPRPTPATSPAATPATPVAKKPERTWGQAAKDTALGVAQGAVNLVGGLADAQEAASPTGIINTAVGLAKRAVPSANIPRLPDLSNTASIAAGKVLGADSMPTTAEATGAATQAITEKLSPALQQEKQELNETEGFLDSAKKVITSPKLLSQFTAEQVPNLLALGAGSRVSAVEAAGGVVARALAGGATREAAEAAGQAAAKHGAEKFIVGANPIMEGGSASQQAQQDAMQLPEETWQKDPSYQAMLASGVDPLAAKRELSQNAGAAARLIGGVAGYVGGKIAAPFEADVFTRQLARKPVAMLAGAGREAAEEGIQEGGSQLGSNVGVQTIDPARETTAGVGQAAGIGSTLGAVMGGGLAIGGAATSKRPQPTVAPAPPPLPAGPITRAADPAAVDVVVPAARPFPQATPGSIADVANLVPAAPPPLPEPAPEPSDEEIRASRPDSGNPADPGYIRVQHDVAKQTMQKERIAQQLRDAKKSGDESALATALEEQRAYRTSVLRTDTIHDRIDQIKHKDDAEARAELESLNGELDKRRAVATESENLSTGTGESSTAPAAPVAPAPPWVNPETGEMREPADREIEEVMHNLINQATAGGGGINTPVMRKVLTEQMGLTSARIQPLMAKVKADRKKGLTAPADLEQQLVDQVRNAGRSVPATEPVPSSPEATVDPAPSLIEEPAPAQLEPEAIESPAPASAEDLPLPASVAPPTADPQSAPADLPAPDKSPTAQPQSGASGDLQYDESPELLDSDITTPSGGSFSSKGAAEATAKRHDGARVFPLEDGTFTVRTPAAVESGAAAGTLSPGPATAADGSAQAAVDTAQPAAAPAALGAANPQPEPDSVQVPSTQVTPAGEVAQAAAPATLDEAAHQAATSHKNDIPHPTDAQKEAGNYKKGHARLAGLDVSIENPAGSRRHPDWPPLKNHYGYFKGSIGADKDHVDVFMTDKADDASRPVFVVDQRHRNGKFDEHKVVLGAANEAEARATYLQNYEKGWAGLQGITQMSQDEFKAWIKDPAKTTKPAAGKVNTGRAVTQPKPARAVAPNSTITPSVKADIPVPAKRAGAAVVAPKPKRQPVEARQDPPAPAAVISDVGEKIGGARKDVWKDRGLQLSDLDSMTGGEQAMFTNKDNVWKPDFGQQINTGMEPLAAAAAKLMWGRVPKEPYSDTDQGRRDYVKALTMIRGILEKAKTLEDLRTAGDRFQVMTGESVARYGGWTKARVDAPVYTAAWGQSGNSFKPFGWQYKDESKAKELLDRGWPGESGWRSKYRVREGFLRLANGERGTKFMVRDRAKNGIYHGNTTEGYATREEAEAFAAELFAGRKADPKNVVKDPPRPHLDDIPRTGKDHRNGKDVAAEDFRSAFGFRGVEFGNWAAQDERQKLINLAYDGLMDMADLLGVPPAAISLDGTLGLALGARGKGKAAAHYEPGKVVINMTKISGAGALAHEWGHAMDHYFGEFGQDKPYGGLGKYASGGRGKPTLHTPEAFARLRPEMQTAWRDVLRSIYENRIDKAEKVRELELHGEQLDARIEAMQEAGSKEPTAVAALAVMRNRRLAVKNELDFARGEPDDTTWTKGQSDVLAALTKEGMGEYWKRPTELLARSFEAYVNSKIKDKGNKSQYLVSVPSHPAWPQGKQLAAVSKAFDKFFDVVQTKQTERGTALFSKAGRAGSDRVSWAGFLDIDIASPFGPGQVRLSAHAGYAAAKAGDIDAAMDLTEQYITPELVDRYKALIGDAKPRVVPVLAEEASGRNRIPAAFAVHLSNALGLQVEKGIVQSVRAHHTDAGAYARIGNQAAFDGPVEAGQTYLILDDAVTMGGTLANLRGHIEANGGLVMGAGVLSGHPNSASIPIKAATEQRLREDFGDELQTYLQGEFGFGIQHLTEGEAAQIRSARTLVELRNRISQGRLRAGNNEDAGDARRAQINEGPRDAGLSTSGLPMARAQEIKSELTKDWGDNGPSVILVASAEDFPDSAKVDPGYARAEGLYNGRPTVWLNVGNIRTEVRFAQVLAHEAIGHYGVERVVGEKEWESIVSSIEKLDGNDATSQALKDVFADVRKRYGDIDRTSFAKEAIAVMAERGIRNSFVARLIAAVRRFLRRVMPSRTWSEGDVLDLLTQSDSFLRAGRNAEERAATVQAYSFSRAQIDGAGQRFVDQNGGRFVQRGDQWYLAGKDGQPRDFLTLGEATAEAERTSGRIEADPNEGARRTWSVTLPGGAELSQQANAVLFSRPAVLDDLDAVRASLESSSVLDRAKQLIKDLTPGKVKDAGRQTWLAALTTRHLTELGQDYFSNIKHYSDYLAEMQADRNALQADAEGLAESARKWAGKNRTEAAAMFDVMHEATIDGVDPAEDYAPLEFKFSGKNHVVTPKSIKEALAALRQLMRERSGDNKTDMIQEAKVLRGMPARERARAQKYAPLVVKFNALSPEAQQLYREMRDKYSNRSDQVEQALIARIKDTDADEGHKRKIIDVIRQQFESNRLQGVYFPLQRFGKYFVAAEKDGVPTFQMFEKLSDLGRAEKGLRDRGFTINGRGLKDQGKAKDAPSGTFVAEVMEKLNRAGVSDKTQDEIYQIYLQSLPEMSMRKHAIHRKSIPGFDPDGLRAFAYNMHHGSHQLARLRFGHKLTAVIGVLKQQQKNLAKDPGSDTQKIVAGDAILQELDKRHEWIMNPTDSAITNLVSSAGFAYYLGLTPAASLVNLTQNALVTFPYLAARFGGIKAMNYMLSAFKDAGRTVGHIQKTLTDPDEQRAHAALQVMGALDKTQAHNLAGIAEGGLQGYNPAWSKAMEIIGWGFHKTEVINRETTGMAAYRLARAAGESFDQAIKTASDAIWDTHFDYSNANRARFMQSGAAKVLLMFRQYSLNMTWHLGRMVWQATKGQSPEVKKLARRNLAGILGMSAVFSGTVGLPMAGVIMGTLNALQASFGDDDEPWDAETEFRAFLVDMLGEGAADVLLHGGVNAVTGADIAGRTGLSEMWFRDADKELEGRGYYYSLLEQAAGPMGGVLKNAIVGKNMIDEGHTWRGVETMLPKALKDMMKGARYATQGVNTLRGDPLVADSSLFDALLQVNGFTPAQVASQYDRNRQLGNYEQAILDRRSALMDGFAMALRTGDNEARATLVTKIQAFNSKNPEVAISSAGIRRSIQARARYSAKAEAGMVINQKLKRRLTERVPE